MRFFRILGLALIFFSFGILFPLDLPSLLVTYSISEIISFPKKFL